METNITDWIMVAITAIYVIATIVICVFNYKTAKAANLQIQESKRQFDETRRLQIMPYLQVTINTKKDGEIWNPVSEAWFIISDSDKDNTVRSDYYITFENIGLGMLHHTKILWNSKSKHNDGYPAKDIVMAINSPWRITGAFFAERAESDDPIKSKRIDCSIDVTYEDLIGNSYSQKVEMWFYIHHTKIELGYYFISPPMLAAGETYPVGIKLNKCKY